jgi:ribulose-phosphate 3-epimerase
MIISPSVLSADFANLQRDIEMLHQSEAEWIHIDVMDGMFVPNITFGMPVLKAIKKYAKKPLDVHLMIVQPERYLADFKEAGADHISVHIEACPHLHRTLQQIRQLGCKAGVAFNPHTPIAALEAITQEADLFLLMSVNPGFGGQKFIENSIQRTAALKQLLQKTGSKAQIEIDGGVSLVNAAALAQAGADALVAGNFVFSAPDPIQAISDLKKTAEQK